MSQEQEFLKELKLLFKKYQITINHSLDYDYDEEISGDELYLSNKESIMVYISELKEKLASVKI